MKKEQGNVANIMVTGIFILAMLTIMLAFMDNIQLIQQKAEIDQLARRYILRMETTGGLLQDDRTALLLELAGQGVTGVELEGTTFGESGYGTRIVLQIRGVLGGKYAFEEKRVSTAKN